MATWNDLLNEIQERGSVHDIIRRESLKRLHEVTGRNVIIYYSGWLQKGSVRGTEINDEDKNGFMTVIHGLDRNLGLDLVLHTQGGDGAATESLVDYLRSMFGTNIRAIVPQLAMSAGTMIACACEKIVMGKPSSLGPIDPQLNGIPAHGVVEEFQRAQSEVSKDATQVPIWQVIISKYTPAFVGECEKAIAWSSEMTSEWLRTGMFQSQGEDQSKATITRIVDELGDHAITKSHARHLSLERCKEIGLEIETLEESQEMQDAVLTTHHACMLTLSGTPAMKIIENHNGKAFVKVQLPQVLPPPYLPMS